MWLVRALALVALLVGACKEIPVDNGTATVIKRTRDTIIHHDIRVMRDTTVRLDTIITVNHDTVFWSDTIISTMTIIQIDTIFTRDTVIQTDTIKLHDTASYTDTVKVNGGTVVVRDTIVRIDTVRLVATELPRSGILYRKIDGGGIQSVPIEIDDLTRLTVQVQGNTLEMLNLKLIARVRKEYDTTKWGVPPSWIYLLVPRLELFSGKGKAELQYDPWSNTLKPGLAIVPRYPYNGRWLATDKERGSGGSFVVTEVDNSGRWIYGYVKAEFNELDATVDSLALKFRY